MAIRFKLIVFDFDGVVARGKFYSGVENDNAKAWNFIQDQVFGKESELFDKWMRGQTNYKEVNKFISENTGVEVEELNKYLFESCEKFKIEPGILELAKSLCKSGVKIALVTNNVDVFNEAIIKNYNLDKVFPIIVNSFSYGALKTDSDGLLFDIALKRSGEIDYSNAFLIDDSDTARKLFDQKGGQTFPYTNFEAFDPWLKQNLL